MDAIDLTALHRQARAALARGDPVSALGPCEQLLTRRGNDPAVLILRAEIAFAAEDLDAELDYVTRAVRAEPRNAQLRDHLGKCYAFRGAYARALGQFDKAVKLDPAAPGPIAGRAHVFIRQNKYEKARRLLEPLVRGGEPAPLVAALYLRVLVHDGELDEAVALGRSVLAAGHRPDLHLRATGFQLARAHEQRGEIEEAFQAAVRANAMLPAAFDAAACTRATDALIENFTAGRLAALPRPAERSEVPLFIVGVPRCGSTLVERILATHPQVHGAGEIRTLLGLERSLPQRIDSTLPYPACVADLRAEDVEALGRSYLQTVTRLAPRAGRIVDKELGNHRRLGLIELLFPAARVIHCRRDPMDTCLSCFMEPFSPTHAPFTADLRSLGLFYRQYQRLMQHWEQVLGIALLVVDYEAMVDDPEGQTRRLLDFCGLPWDARCLRFHETARVERTLSYDQVRRPVYRSSVGRAARFGARLDPLREALAGR